MGLVGGFVEMSLNEGRSATHTCIYNVSQEVEHRFILWKRVEVEKKRKKNFIIAHSFLHTLRW